MDNLGFFAKTVLIFATLIALLIIQGLGLGDWQFWGIVVLFIIQGIVHTNEGIKDGVAIVYNSMKFAGVDVEQIVDRMEACSNAIKKEPR